MLPPSIFFLKGDGEALFYKTLFPAGRALWYNKVLR